MFRKIVTGIIVIPLAVIIIAFAVANRQIVTVSFDPFSTTHPAYAVPLPLFVLIFILLILGVIVGGIAAWIRQSKWRRAVRKLDAEVHLLHDQLDAARRREHAGEPQKPDPADHDPHAVLPPPGS